MEIELKAAITKVVRQSGHSHSALSNNYHLFSSESELDLFPICVISYCQLWSALVEDTTRENPVLQIRDFNEPHSNGP